MRQYSSHHHPSFLRAHIEPYIMFLFRIYSTEDMRLVLYGVHHRHLKYDYVT